MPVCIPIMNWGMKMTTRERLKNQGMEGHLIKLHEFFQTNLNNHFPSHDSMKRFFRNKIDMGITLSIKIGVWIMGIMPEPRS